MQIEIRLILALLFIDITRALNITLIVIFLVRMKAYLLSRASIKAYAC